MSDNLASVGRMLQDTFDIIPYDLPNHGRSPTLESATFVNMARMLDYTLHQHVYLKNIDKVHMVGHSLGGKLAMVYSLLYPQRIKNVVALDIAPVEYPPEHIKEIEALVDLNRLFHSSRKKDILTREVIRSTIESHISDKEIAMFLRKNVYTKSDGVLGLYARIEHIKRNYDILRSFPVSELKHLSYNGNILFVMAGQSDYIKPEYYENIEHFFPTWELEEIKDSKHAIHAYKPRELEEILRGFYQFHSAKHE